MFKVGDRVWSYSMQKWGTIKEINMKREKYPILVFFDDGDVMTYTDDGREILEYKSQDIFKNEMVMVKKK